MWALPTLLFMIACFHRPAPGVLAKELMQTFHATGAIVGLLSATYFYAYAGFMLPAGLLVDWFGARVVVSAGGAVMAAGTIAMGGASAQGPLFAGRFIVGMGAAVMFVGALKIAAAWCPSAQFGALSALTAAVGLLGVLLGTAPLAWLVALAGWRGALIVVGCVTLAAAAVCAGLVRDRPAASVVEPAAPGLRPIMTGMLAVMRNRHTWPPFAAFFFSYAATGNLMLWVVPYLRDVYGLDTPEAALYATAISLALLLGGPLAGWVSDRTRRRKLPYVVLTAAHLAAWLTFVVTLGSLPLGWVAALLFAMGAVGVAFVLTWPIGREVNPPHLAGIAVAVVNLGGFLGAALSQGSLGAVLDARWAGVLVDGARVYPLEAYRTAFALCAGFILVSMLVTLFMRETHGRQVSSAEEERSRVAPVAGRPRSSPGSRHSLR